jgi:hypothetical protein
VNPETNEILASELAANEIGDSSIVGPLLEQIQSPMTSVTGDGAYDGEPVYRAIAPRATAVSSSVMDTAPSLRDRHIQTIQEKGRTGWQKAVGYGKRALVETALFRYKNLIGPTLCARKFEAQQVEARVACSVIHRVTHLGMPISQRVR